MVVTRSHQKSPVKYIMTKKEGRDNIMRYWGRGNLGSIVGVKGQGVTLMLFLFYMNVSRMHRQSSISSQPLTMVSCSRQHSRRYITAEDKAVLKIRHKA